MKSRILLLTFILISVATIAFAQQQKQQQNKDNLVQFSGMVLDGSDEQLYPVPYTNIYVKGAGRGTYSDFQGFFSIVVEKGDVVIFSAVGYKTVEFNVSKDLKEDRYSVVQLMTRDTINLPEAVIFPWPSRDHFKLEFLAMDVTPELAVRAQKNLAQDAIERQRKELPYDGGENTSYYLRQQSRQYYYIGQQPPMNIFNPIAWSKFFNAWKNGDFKKKKE